MPFPIRATYRVQFRPEFTLNDAAKLIPYLSALGISHLYASPFLQAAPGSTHGYDVVDYSKINAELGGAEALDRLVESERQAGLGMILDMVPNHMAINARNPWWWDVLRNGSASRFASYFDVEWNPPEARHANAVLAPVLGDQYGRVIDAGEISVAYNGDVFTVRYADHIYPVDPSSISSILSAAAKRTPNVTLSFLADAFAHLPVPQAADLPSARRRYRDEQVLHELLAKLVREQPSARQSIQDALAELNADPVALDAFLRLQNYRLAMWKISARELGYRRFFDINDMIGVRMEEEQVYRDTHELVLDLVQRGALDGLRIDHPDGLRNPIQYFSRLRWDVTRLHRPQLYIVIEKILEPGEPMRTDWQVDGTVGYDFLNRVNGLFVDSSAEVPLTRFYQEFTGLNQSYDDLVHEKKLLAARDVLGSDLSHLAELLLQVCERHPRYRDYARAELVGVLSETAACLPVYRTYLAEVSTAPGTGAPEMQFSAVDQAYVNQAIAAAKEHRPDLDARLFDFLQDLLLLHVDGATEHELALRFQQFTGPVMAKGVEDTVFYIYSRFVSLNEVGGDPGRFGISLDEFHNANSEMQSHWPQTMLATSTHDTKRGEDVRARLNVISEIPEEWIAAVRHWSEMNEGRRAYRIPEDRVKEQHIPTGDAAMRGAGSDRRSLGADEGNGLWPERNTEYLIYQTLIGAWPIDAERAVAYILKATREAKVFTSWTNPDADYEGAVEGFVRAILGHTQFVSDMQTFVNRIIELGRINSLAQTLLKLTAPGIPDIYQGCETWNLSLVDPDNRRPVDYNQANRLLNELSGNLPPEAILKRMDEGLPKLWIIRQALALRAEHFEWFGAQGSYSPLGLEGDSDLADDTSPAIAYRRADRVLVAVPRLIVKSRERWRQVHLTLPRGCWRNRLTGEVFDQASVTLSELWARFPVALLVREEE